MVRPARPILFFLLLTAIVFAALPVKAEFSRFGTIQLQVVLHFEFLMKRYVSTVLALFLLSRRCCSWWLSGTVSKAICCGMRVCWRRISASMHLLLRRQYGLDQNQPGQ